MGILGAMMFVRFGLEPLVKSLRTVFKASGSWEKSSEYHFLREVKATAAYVARHVQHVATQQLPHAMLRYATVRYDTVRYRCYAV